MPKSLKEIRTEIMINASPERIWGILADTKSYPQWNPFMVWVKGELISGKKIIVRMHPPGGSPMTFKPLLLIVHPVRELRWIGHLLFPGLVDGEHIFEITPNGDGSTQFVQREKFTGILVPLFRTMLDVNTRQGFEAMNAKLKERAETGGSARSSNH